VPLLPRRRHRHHRIRPGPRRLLRTESYDPARLTFVKTILNVAPADTQRVIETLLPQETVLLTDFGLTEGVGMITVTPRDAAGEDRLTRNGTPLPGIEVRVTNPENPKTIQPNDMPGEIQFRGINAFRAYYKNPAETAATIIDDGWVRTGDLGTLDSRGQLLFLAALSADDRQRRERRRPPGRRRSYLPRLRVDEHDDEVVRPRRTRGRAARIGQAAGQIQRHQPHQPPALG
jgi:acyl-CoA synthetase (AMP-forming)/AMP-acid ligase II